MKAYQSNLEGAGSLPDPIRQSVDSGLFPVFTANDLKALSIILSGLQKQLFDLEDVLYLSPFSHRKNISVRGKNRVFEYEKQLQEIASIRLLTVAKGGRNRSYTAAPLFTPEVVIEETAPATFDVKLTPSSFGGEVLIGYGEPYTDLLRDMRGEVTSSDFLGDHPPLSLWRSVWLDLNGAEQALFLQLEKSMQWDVRCLTFDGSFGRSLYDLFQCLGQEVFKMTDGRLFREKILFLDKIGKKLIDHGVLCFDDSDKYLAFSSHATSGLEVTWESPLSRFLDLEAKSYFELSCKYLLEKVFKVNFTDIMSLMLGHAGEKAGHSDLYAKIMTAFKFLNDSGCEGMSKAVTVLNGNLPVLAAPLFFEWNIRATKAHPQPLPEDIKTLCREFLGGWDSPDQITQKFNKFSQMVTDNGKLFADVLSMDMASIAHPHFRKNVLQRLSTPSLEDRPREESVDKSNTVQIKPPHEPIKTVNGSDHRGQSFIRKQATEELIRMRESNPERYKGLKQAYLDALDSQSRKIISEVQRRLQPHVFDQQLKNSLVKFMVENPSLWQSN